MLWFRFRGPRRKLWTVYIGTHREYPALAISDEYAIAAPSLYDGARFFGAVTVFEEQSIYVSSREPRSSWDECVLHEMMHVAANTKCEKDFSDEAEENVIRGVSPRLLGMLLGHGFKLPKKPRMPRKCST